MILYTLALERAVRIVGPATKGDLFDRADESTGRQVALRQLSLTGLLGDA
jgi:hypothetical protein